jgi:hypothetical protein
MAEGINSVGKQIKSLLAVFARHFFLGLANVLHVQKRLFNSSAPNRECRDELCVESVGKGVGGVSLPAERLCTLAACLPRCYVKIKIILLHEVRHAVTANARHQNQPTRLRRRH